MIDYIGILCWIVLLILGLVEVVFQKTQKVSDLKHFEVALILPVSPSELSVYVSDCFQLACESFMK